MNVTDILLAASVGCNLWFLFLLLYDKIMETKFVRFLTSITGLWRSLEDRGTIPETVQGEAPKNENDIIGKSRFKMASTRTNTATPVQEAATSEKGIELSEEEATFDDGNRKAAILAHPLLYHLTGGELDSLCNELKILRTDRNRIDVFNLPRL